MKRRIRLIESELRRMITESVKSVLRESAHPRRRINEVSTSLVRRAREVILALAWNLDEWNEYLNDGYVSDDDEDVDLEDY